MLGLQVEVRYKIQTRLSNEFAPASTQLGHKMFESRQKINIFLKPISSAQFLFPQPITMEYLANFGKMAPK